MVFMGFLSTMYSFVLQQLINVRRSLVPSSQRYPGVGVLGLLAAHFALSLWAPRLTPVPVLSLGESRVFPLDSLLSRGGRVYLCRVL